MVEATQQPAAIGVPEFQAEIRPDVRTAFSLRTLFWVLASGACYYLATRIAWLLCFPDSKVSLFFPPHAVLVSILLLVPTRHWWAYTLAAVVQPFLRHAAGGLAAAVCLALRGFRCREDVLTAAGIRFFIKSPFHRSRCAKRSSSCWSRWSSFRSGPPSGAPPSPSPIASERTTGSNGATSASRMA